MFTIDFEMILIDREESTRIEKKLLEEERKKNEYKKEEDYVIDGDTWIDPKNENTLVTSGNIAIEKSPELPENKLSRRTAFHGSLLISSSTFKLRLQDVADEILLHLAEDPEATLDIRLEISANFPKGASSTTQRTVSENAHNLGFNVVEWE